MGIFDFLSVDKYYKMDDEKLELEAQKYRLQEYADPNRGAIIRERIIHQLIEKDKANNSRYAVFISILSLIVSIVAIIFSTAK